MKHIATIFLVLLFGSLIISSTTQELSDGKSLNDDGRSIRLKRNSKDDSLDEITSLMETVQHSIFVLATRQNELLQKINGIETKVTDLSLKQERTESNLQAKIADLIAKHDEFLPSIVVQVEERLESINFSLGTVSQVEKQNAAIDRQLMSINSSLHFKLDAFKTDMHSAAMNATLFNTQILNSFEKLNNISLVLHQNGDAMNASIQVDRSKLTTQAITNLNLILVNQSAYDWPSVLATKIAKGEIPYTNEWVVIQRRGTPLKHDRIREEFNRSWADYVRGFGKIDADYWIGLEAMHLLSSAGFNQLRVDLEDWEGDTAYAEYDAFAISAAWDQYRLSISGYSGNAGDSFAFNNGSRFSTQDQDHDTSSSAHYAYAYGPWWFSKGVKCSLNGQYHSSEVDTFGHGILWLNWKGSGYSLKKTEMKLRRRQ